MPATAVNRLKKLHMRLNKGETLSNESLLVVLEEIIKDQNVKAFQEQTLETEKLKIRTICSESFE